ncbi:MAG TPA: amidohydrolase family protein [Vicinamibacterales bacterium]|nr:amidohydrolase family protein [Vicinamibacterales bacterium]
MRRQLFVTVSAIAAAVLVVAAQAPPQPAVAFVGVSVIPMDRERVIQNQTVVVRGGRIAEIGPAGKVALGAGTKMVDGKNRYLIPALAEMHAHIPPGDNVPDAEIERVLFMYAAKGAGTARGMLGHRRHLAWRERAAKAEIFSPVIFTSGPSLSGNSAPAPDAAEKMVREQKAAGFDFLKIHPGLSREAFDAMVRTAREVGIPFAGHVPADVGLARALEARYATIDHLDGYVEALAKPGAPSPSQTFGLNLVAHVDESRVPELVKQTRVAGTAIVPTEILLENWVGEEDPELMAKRPEMRYVEPAVVRKWVEQKRTFEKVPVEDRRRFIALRRRLIKALHDGGVPILLGSDAPQTWNVPGFSLHRELQTYVAAGLTPYEALATGTRNVAAFFRREREAGTIEIGKRADLVLLDGNPLADITQTENIAGVMLGGRWMTREEIQRRLDGYARGTATAR